ncbi:hypothetical protein Leucomu_14210 [Leucobacter muris]|uniref:Uncharacterized protein n=1 Tax=Leucobacter muris TaxID=1935379 RepID=A0ABX5QIJ1_9MICO|nr:MULTISPECIES: hypothetical protein [Leucobacter]QAB18912.1 hypothetical protein Leucomu_14210 [Leucobacter muris]
MNPFRLSTRLQQSPRGRQPASRHAAQAVRAEAGGAVQVPWRVVARSASGVIEVEQCGDGPLHSVRFALAGGGMLGLSLPRTVYPDERLRVVVRGAGGSPAAQSPDAMLVLRWFQPDGRELLWPIAL